MSSPSSEVIEHQKLLNERTYEQSKSLNEYLLLHYGEKLSGSFLHCEGGNTHGNVYPLDIDDQQSQQHNYGEFGYFNTTTGELQPPLFPTYALNFPYRVAQMALYWYKKLHPECEQQSELTAFDLGCAVGRTTFELTPLFTKVVGLDYSFSFVNAAKQLATGEQLAYSVPIEGDVSFSSKATLDTHVIPSRAEFIQGDACSLDTSIQYDCITAANLIDRLPSPRAFLTSLAKLTKQGGIVVLTSPYTWLKEFTPVSEWLVDDNNRSTFEALSKIMKEDFTLVHQSHMPFCIRETARKSQFTFAHCTVWQRK